MNLWTVENITYNRQILDRGVLLAQRKYRSELVRTQKPCQLFEGDLRISYQTPHKRDLSVFVPVAELAPGKTLTWLRFDQDTGKTFESDIQILEVSTHHVKYEVLREEEKTFQRRRFKRRMTTFPRSSFGLRNNPFLLQNPTDQQNLVPDRIVWDNLTFIRKSNFCFIWDPDRLKRTGTPYRQVFPEEIREETFRYDFEPYDLLTGRKLDTFSDDVRNAHFRVKRKPSPTWKQI